jgi:hypothetical protein
MTQADYRQHVRNAGLMLAWAYRGPGDDGSPFEPKADAWGWLDGKAVAVDYANLVESGGDGANLRRSRRR